MYILFERNNSWKKRLYAFNLALYSQIFYSVPAEADLCNKPLNLRFDDEGYITGDLQMVLPPIRAISLNPYTGWVVNVTINKRNLWQFVPHTVNIWETRFFLFEDELFIIVHKENI